MERDLRLHCYIPQRQNFNSHAHVERDRKTTEHDTDSRISTHTLTWSVTHGTLVQRQISNFNSHAHVERDWGGIDYVLCKKISTHTLTWSVTIQISPCIGTNSDFNSHAHVERDFHFYLPLFLPHYFNSHAHVERDCTKWKLWGLS